MKKALSGAFLIVFLFNVGGYYIVFWCIRIQKDQQLTTRLDSNQYNPEETIQLKIPVTLPYPIYHQGFQRVDGRFEHQGEFFKLVKHKFQNDTLYIVCIRDHATRELVNTLTQYVELTQQLPGTSQKAWNLLSKLIKDFYSQEEIIFLPEFAFSLRTLFPERATYFPQAIIPVHGPPPKG